MRIRESAPQDVLFLIKWMFKLEKQMCSKHKTSPKLIYYQNKHMRKLKNLQTYLLKKKIVGRRKIFIFKIILTVRKKLNYVEKFWKYITAGMQPNFTIEAYNIIIYLLSSQWIGVNMEINPSYSVSDNF